MPSSAQQHQTGDDKVNFKAGLMLLYAGGQAVDLPLHDQHADCTAEGEGRHSDPARTHRNVSIA